MTSCEDTATTLANVTRTHRRIAPHIRRTPLLQSRVDGEQSVLLKCENLQITSSFKVRGALSALLGYRDSRPDVWERIQADGVVTASSGNFAQGLAHVCALLDVACTIIVPELAAPYKLARISRHHRRVDIIQVPYERWRETMIDGSFGELPGFFLSSEADPYVSLGNATIAAEILEDRPDVDVIVVPFGGGHLAYGIACVVEALRPDVRVYAVELATGAPLSASLRAGRPVEVEYRRSFVDGIGASFVIPAQFDRLRDKLSDVVTVTPDEVADAMTFLAVSENMIAEGAGAAALAAALKYAAPGGWKRPCCVVSGGVIAPQTFSEMLRTTPPSPRPVSDGASTQIVRGTRWETSRPASNNSARRSALASAG